MLSGIWPTLKKIIANTTQNIFLCSIILFTVTGKLTSPVSSDRQEGRIIRKIRLDIWHVHLSHLLLRTL